MQKEVSFYIRRLDNLMRHRMDQSQAKACVETPYGTAGSEWKLENGTLTLKVTVPVSTQCAVILPDGQTRSVGSGSYEFSCKMK